MKKILLSLFICLVFLFSACSPDGGQPTDPDNPNPDVPVAPVPSEENVVKALDSLASYISKSSSMEFPVETFEADITISPVSIREKSYEIQSDNLHVECSQDESGTIIATMTGDISMIYAEDTSFQDGVEIGVISMNGFTFSFTRETYENPEIKSGEDSFSFKLNSEFNDDGLGFASTTPETTAPICAEMLISLFYGNSSDFELNASNIEISSIYNINDKSLPDYDTFSINGKIRVDSLEFNNMDGNIRLSASDSYFESYQLPMLELDVGFSIDAADVVSATVQNSSLSENTLSRIEDFVEEWVYSLYFQ